MARPTSILVLFLLMAACEFPRPAHIADDEPSSSGTAVEISNSILIAGLNGTGMFLTIDAADNFKGALILNNTFVNGNIGCHGETSKHFESNIFYNCHFINDSLDCLYNYNLITPYIDLGGVGNKTGDPLFANFGNGDFHLLEGSPAIDAANPDRGPPFGHDRDGVVRPQGNGVEIGAFEYIPQRPRSAAPARPGPQPASSE